MGRYHEALTLLFLSGTFPDGAVRPALERRPAVAVPGLASMRRVPAIASAQRRVASASVQRAPVRRATRQLKFRPAPPERNMTHPGRILAQHLYDLGLTASDLARDIDVPVNRVTAIINGQRGVTADTALRLGHWFGVDAEDWLELQLQYELALARDEVGSGISKLPRLVDRVS